VGRVIGGRRPLSAVILLIIVCALGCEPRGPVELVAVETHMGTVVKITAIGPDRALLERSIDAAFAEIRGVDRLMSPRREDSDLMRINRLAGKGPVEVAPEVFEVVERAVSVSVRTGGAFDVSVAGLFGLWSFDPLSARVPAPGEIEEKLGLVDYRLIVMDKERSAVGLAREGMTIGLGGIAKGYAVDRAAEALAENGVSMAMVNAGGDLRVIGAHGDRPWRVGIRHPRKIDAVIATLSIEDRAMATSGDYEKFFEKDGRRYCHILDPRSGEPADVVMSVTVVADRAWRADAMATALFVLGREAGMDLVEENGAIEAIIIDRNGERFVSSGLRDKVEWSE